MPGRRVSHKYTWAYADQRKAGSRSTAFQGPHQYHFPMVICFFHQSTRTVEVSLPTDAFSDLSLLRCWQDWPQIQQEGYQRPLGLRHRETHKNVGEAELATPYLFWKRLHLPSGEVYTPFPLNCSCKVLVKWSMLHINMSYFSLYKFVCPDRFGRYGRSIRKSQKCSSAFHGPRNARCSGRGRSRSVPVGWEIHAPWAALGCLSLCLLSQQNY